MLNTKKNSKIMESIDFGGEYFLECFLKNLKEKYEVVDEAIEAFKTLFKAKLEDYQMQGFIGLDDEDTKQMIEENAAFGAQNFYNNLEGMCFDEIVFRSRYEQELKEKVEKILDLETWMEKMD